MAGRWAVGNRWPADDRSFPVLYGFTCKFFSQFPTPSFLFPLFIPRRPTNIFPCGEVDWLLFLDVFVGFILVVQFMELWFTDP